MEPTGLGPGGRLWLYAAKSGRFRPSASNDAGQRLCPNGVLGIYDPTERQRVIVGGLDGGIMSGDFGFQPREECRDLGVDVDRFSHRG